MKTTTDSETARTAAQHAEALRAAARGLRKAESDLQTFRSHNARRTIVVTSEGEANDALKRAIKDGAVAELQSVLTFSPRYGAPPAVLVRVCGTAFVRECISAADGWYVPENGLTEPGIDWCVFNGHGPEGVKPGHEVIVVLGAWKRRQPSSEEVGGCLASIWLEPEHDADAQKADAEIARLRRYAGILDEIADSIDPPYSTPEKARETTQLREDRIGFLCQILAAHWVKFEGPMPFHEIKTKFLNVMKADKGEVQRVVDDAMDRKLISKPSRGFYQLKRPH